MESMESYTCPTCDAKRPTYTSLPDVIRRCTKSKYISPLYCSLLVLDDISNTYHFMQFFDKKKQYRDQRKRGQDDKEEEEKVQDDEEAALLLPTKKRQKTSSEVSNLDTKLPAMEGDGEECE